MNFSCSLIPIYFVQQLSLWKKQLLNISFSDRIIIIKDIRDKILANIKTCTAMIGCPRYIFAEENFSYFKHLDWIHAGGAGIEDFLTNDFVKSNTVFTNGKIIQGPEVADHAMALLLSFTRNLYWLAKNETLVDRPIELFNKKALIIGLGGIGVCLAERLNAFGTKVDAFTNEMTPMLSFINNIFFGKDLINRIKDYDIVVCTAPHTKKTYRLLNYPFFKAMKKKSIFVNVSRGKVVNTEDLIKNNIYKKFRGIGLDVTDPEPLNKSHKLLSAKNVFITPHVAGPSDYNRERGFTLIKNNLERYFSNRELLNIVNKERGY